MSPKPWYKLATPREDLRDGRPLDASEFAVHLDQIRDGRAPVVYQDPERFFERTFLTKGLSDLAAEVIRSAVRAKKPTSAVFNLTTQFGGGKTYALTVLYHLANSGANAKSWQGVSKLFEVAKVNQLSSQGRRFRRHRIRPDFRPGWRVMERLPEKPRGAKSPINSAASKRSPFSPSMSSKPPRRAVM